MAKILYFAGFRDAIGLGQEDIDLLATDTTLAALCERLAARGRGYATAFGDLSKVRGAIDLELAALDAPLGSPAEIAFFPPVTGG